MRARQGGVHALQRPVHFFVPVEKQVDFRRTPAGDGLDPLQPLHPVHRFFQDARHGDHHLVDGHHAVVGADHDAREIRRREHRHRNVERQIRARGRQRQDHEDDGFAVARRPVFVFRGAIERDEVIAHLPLSPPSFLVVFLLVCSGELDLRAVLQSQSARDHDSCTGIHAAENLDLVGRADARLNLVLMRHHVLPDDKKRRSAFRRWKQCRGWNHHGIAHGFGSDRHVHRAAGPQLFAWILRLHPHLERGPLRIHGRAHDRHLPRRFHAVNGCDPRGLAHLDVSWPGPAGRLRARSRSKYPGWSSAACPAPPALL